MTSGESFHCVFPSPGQGNELIVLFIRVLLHCEHSGARGTKCRSNSRYCHNHNVPKGQYCPHGERPPDSLPSPLLLCCWAELHRPASLVLAGIATETSVIYWIGRSYTKGPRVTSHCVHLRVQRRDMASASATHGRRRLPLIG